MSTPSEQLPHEWARVHFSGAELTQSPGATLP